MKVTTHNFIIAWRGIAPVHFSKTTKEELEAEVSGYLKADDDFNSLIRGLLRSVEEQEHVEFLQKVLSPNTTLSLEDLQRIVYLDVDGLRFEVGRLDSWDYTTEELDINLSGSKPLFTEWDDIQEAVLKTYQNGEFEGLTPEHLDTAGDGLLRFLLVEMSRNEDCDSLENAVNRIDTAIRELQGLQSGLERLQLQQSSPAKPRGPSM